MPVYSLKSSLKRSASSLISANRLHNSCALASVISNFVSISVFLSAASPVPLCAVSRFPGHSAGTQTARLKSANATHKSGRTGCIASHTENTFAFFLQRVYTFLRYFHIGRDDAVTSPGFFLLISYKTRNVQHCIAIHYLWHFAIPFIKELFL